MRPVLKRIAELDYLEIYSLFDELFERSKQGSELMLLLDSLTKSERMEFWETLKPLGKMWLQGQEADTGFSPDADPPVELDQQQLHLAEKIVQSHLDRLDSLVEETRLHREEQIRGILRNREILKARMPEFVSDQYMGLPMPSPVKEYPPDADLIELPEPTDEILRTSSIFQCIKQRKSHRKFSDDPLSLAELSYLLWATQGVRKFMPGKKGSFRNAPSGGARQPMETYLAINRAADLSVGIYRYLPFEHKLLFQSPVQELKRKLAEFCYGQQFVGRCAVCFIWTAVPYRIEWRYGPEAKKDILQEAGHICQNLYLASESIRCGTCGINAYDQEEIDRLIGVDGVDEMTVYLAPVGRVGE